MQTSGSKRRATRERNKRARATETPDDQNPKYALQGMHRALLVAAARGHLDLNGIAIAELANRGLDPSTGEWVGFDKADALAEVAKANLGIL